MKTIRIKQNGRLADKLREVGFGGIVDSPRIRELLGLPIHAEPPLRKKVSVIIPAYNVAEYLEDAVGTVLRQSHKNLEIVIVNDGSKDNTGEIADSLARADRRVKVIHKQNAGLGAARNTGLRATTGEYVTFVDSDDQLTPRAIELMLKSLERTGSDFAIGAVERFNSTRTWVPAWVSEVHDEERLGIQAEDHTPVLWDVFVWNKLFRRTVWDERVGLFPEGVLYEDQECTAKLYVEGATFDSLVETVYRWRFRDDGSSITQNKHSLEDLEDRLLVARTVRGVLRHKATESLLDTWYAKLLGDDLYWYMREVPRASEEFWAMLSDAVREFFGEASKSAISLIQFDRRVHVLAIARGTRTDFDLVLDHFQRHGSNWTTRRTDSNNLVGAFPGLAELSEEFSEEELLVDISAFVPEMHLLRQVCEPDGAVRLEGYLFVGRVAASESRTLSADLLVRQNNGEDTGARRLPVLIQSLNEPLANSIVRDALTDHSTSGFSVTIPASVAAELMAMELEGNSGRAVLEISAMDPGRVWTTTAVRLKASGLVQRLPAGQVSSSWDRLLFAVRDGEFCVAAKRVEYSVENATIDGELLRIHFRSNPTSFPKTLTVALSLEGSGTVQSLAQRRPDGQWVAELLLPRNLPNMKSNYRGAAIEVLAEESSHFLDDDAMRPRETSTGQYGLFPNKDGLLQIERYVQFGEAREVTMLDDGHVLRIEGVCKFSRKQIRQATPSLMLWRNEHTIFPKRLEFDEKTGEFVCEFSLVDFDPDGRAVSSPMGSYLLGMLLATGTGLATSFTLLAGAQLTQSLPLELREGTSRVRLQRRGKDGGLEVHLAAPFELDERGIYAQTLLAREYSNLVDEGNVKPTVLFEAFGGRAVGDSPKAIDAVLAKKRPDLQRLWTVRDYSVAVPPGATPVLRYSRAWYEALATSSFLVNNNNFPSFFKKGTQQRYIQTWHGTPLKRVGNDVPSSHLSIEYVNLMERETQQYWDVLLAQTPWAGEVLAAAFRYEGKTIVSGYPRNDALGQPGAHERGALVRRHLGVGSDQMVVLYAPTWRDNIKAANGVYARPDFLSADDLRAKFGTGVVMLVRGHANHAGHFTAKPGPNTIDVSNYPDINDLFSAADVLVTDYSSVQFDFVNTGKPILFLAPDLEAYRDNVRGFYFDFERTAPGPILRTSKEVVDWLSDLERLRDEFAEPYEAYRRRYAGLDDGEAAMRVVASLFTD